MVSKVRSVILNGFNMSIIPKKEEGFSAQLDIHNSVVSAALINIFR